jgi:putative component of toxin-antitoxin plasmid stabilization module
MELRHYLTSTGRDTYQSWLDRLKDLRARVAIQRRVDRVAAGHFGDHKLCRDGVWELRVVLLCGGSKGSQASDIDTAVKYWLDYQRRMG